MKQHITQEEKNKILNFVLNNQSKSCAIAQCFIDFLQIVSLSEYAHLHVKSKRTIQYQAKKLNGITIGGRKFVSFMQ